MKYKVGDWVKCIDDDKFNDDYYHHLTIGKKYKVIAMTSLYTSVSDDNGNELYFTSNRFKDISREDKLKRILNERN